jgi:copper transport protein
MAGADIVRALQSISLSVSPMLPAHDGRRTSLLPRARRVASLLALGYLLLTPALVQAHAILLSSSPSIGSVSARVPARIELRFSERVSLPSNPLHLTLAASGQHVPLGRTSQQDGGRLVTVPITPGNGRVRGVMLLRWSVISDDGDPVSGEFQFAIGAGHPGPLHGRSITETLPAPSRIAAQWLTIAGISVAILGAWLALVASGTLAPRFAVFGGALAALGRGVLLVELAAGSSLRSALDSRAGMAAALALLCFTASVALVRTRSVARPLLVLGVFATAAGGHGPTVAPLLAGTLVFGSHLLAGATWLATLCGLLLVSARRRQLDQRAFAEALRLYVWIAAVSVTALVASGVAMAWLLLGSFGALTSTTDGLFVVAKSALLVAALLIALYQRRRLERYLDRGLRRLARLEWVLLAAATLLGGVMADTLPGSSQAAESRIATSSNLLSGPAIQLADLAGRYTVFLAARQQGVGLTVVGLDGEPLGNERVAVKLIPGGTLDVKTCGPGCRVAATTLRRGGAHALVSIEGPAREHSSATFKIPWPPRPEDAGLLRRVVSNLEQRSRVTFRESATSDSTFRLPPSLMTARSGRTLARELLLLPDGAIDARVVATRIDHGRRLRTLTYFLPGALVWHELVISEDGQILRHTWVTPRHRIVDAIAAP